MPAADSSAAGIARKWEGSVVPDRPDRTRRLPGRPSLDRVHPTPLIYDSPPPPANAPPGIPRPPSHNRPLPPPRPPTPPPLRQTPPRESPAPRPITPPRPRTLDPTGGARCAHFSGHAGSAPPFASQPPTSRLWSLYFEL